jgi:hypothetical protein
MKTKIIFLIFLMTLLSFSSVNAQLADSPWPTFHGNSQRTGISPYDTSHTDGTIYMTSSNPKPGVYAINSDGTEKWFLV